MRLKSQVLKMSSRFPRFSFVPFRFAFVAAASLVSSMALAESSTSAPAAVAPKPSLPEISTPAVAPSKSAPKSSAKAPKASVKTAESKSTAHGGAVLWDSWYTVTVGGQLPYGYYHDRVERKDGKIAFQNQYWKREEGYINEEQLVSFSEDNPLLTPILFTFKGTYRGTTIDIDGNYRAPSISVKVRKDKADLPKIEHSIAAGSFLSSQFPVWLGKHLPDLKVGKRESFNAILEDNLERAYRPVPGGATLAADDEIARKSGTKKIDVEYNDQKSTWYVNATGETERIDILGAPGASIVVQKSTESVARRYLMEK